MIADRLHVLAATLWIALGTPGIVHAQNQVERGWARYGDADFAGALAAFDAAEGARGLDRADAIRLLEGRACAHFALGQVAEMRREVGRLATIAPEHEMGEEIPPDVRTAFDRAVAAQDEPLSLDAHTTAVDQGVRIDAVVQNDPMAVTREVHVEARVDGGEWQRNTEGTLIVQVAQGEAVEWFARALGPGSAPLATVGTAESPQRWSLLDAGATDDGRGGAQVPWLWIGASAAVVVGVITVALVVSAGADDAFDVGAPTVTRM
jgi:hypothetical protein